jgi:hypothetical protein
MARQIRSQEATANLAVSPVSHPLVEPEVGSSPQSPSAKVTILQFTKTNCMGSLNRLICKVTISQFTKYFRFEALTDEYEQGRAKPSPSVLEEVAHEQHMVPRRAMSPRRSFSSLPPPAQDLPPGRIFQNVLKYCNYSIMILMFQKTQEHGSNF